METIIPLALLLTTNDTIAMLGAIAMLVCVREQPWLPNRPVPITVSWTAEGYRRPDTLSGLR